MLDGNKQINYTRIHQESCKRALSTFLLNLVCPETTRTWFLVFSSSILFRPRNVETVGLKVPVSCWKGLVVAYATVCCNIAMLYKRDCYSLQHCFAQKAFCHTFDRQIRTQSFQCTAAYPNRLLQRQPPKWF